MGNHGCQIWAGEMFTFLHTKNWNIIMGFTLVNPNFNVWKICTVLNSGSSIHIIVWEFIIMFIFYQLPVYVNIFFVERKYFVLFYALELQSKYKAI